MKLLSTILTISSSIAVATESFESQTKGAFQTLDSSYGTINAAAGHAEIINKARTGKQALRLIGGADKQVAIQLSQPLQKEALFQLWTERWTSRGPFEVTIYAEDATGKRTQMAKETNQGVGSFNKQYSLKLPKGTSKILFHSNTAEGGGLIIDDVTLHIGKMTINNISIEDPGEYPMMKRAEVNAVVRLKLDTQGAEGGAINNLKLRVSPASAIESVALRSSNAQGYDFYGAAPLATAKPDAQGNISFNDGIPVTAGENFLWLDARLSPNAKVGEEVTFSDISCTAQKQSFKAKAPITQNVGYLVASGGDKVKQRDGSVRASKCFRIPGLITTKKGNLVGTYDARYHHAGDLCADIDVSVVRSEDGGLTWTDNEIVLDIGPGTANGVGDPCILQDHSGRIWIQGLGTHFAGGASLNVSKAGNDPKTTGQWYMTYSDDEGKTWTRDYVNPTKQIKRDEWTCILAGPGSGITLKDGTIVFPAQIWQNGAPTRCMSTICYSKDGGKNWVYGTGVPRATSESQVVQLEDGSIMINARDEARSGKRAVFITKDLGKTWTAHESNLKALQEPVCQASLISINTKKYGRVLLFSNPKFNSRKKMTIRYSTDGGKTWSEGYEYDSRDGAGYSSLALIDENTVGVFYESSQSHSAQGRNFGISFMRIPLDDIMKAK